MNVIALGPVEIGISAALVLALAVLSMCLRLAIHQQLLIAALRSGVQLLLLGLILNTVFASTNVWMIGGITLVMLMVAGYEVNARQQKKLTGIASYSIGTISMFVSSFSVALLTVTVIIDVDPWYTPQYLIPLLGMLLGNTMNGVSISLDRLTQTAWQQRNIIESRLMQGESWSTAIDQIRRDSLRAGLIPIVNAMMTAGIVSLPGMMTGQVLAGTPPLEAAKYQILILFLIAAGTGLGAMVAMWLASGRLFDKRERLRLDRLS